MNTNNLIDLFWLCSFWCWNSLTEHIQVSPTLLFYETNFVKSFIVIIDFLIWGFKVLGQSRLTH